MGKSQRTKGATYEREVGHTLARGYGMAPVRRELSQTRDGGCDLVAGPLVVECKRRKTLATLRQWLAQVTRATPKGKVPVVVCREDQGASMVLLTLDDFIFLTRAKVAELTTLEALL